MRKCLLLPVARDTGGGYPTHPQTSTPPLRLVVVGVRVNVPPRFRTRVDDKAAASRDHDLARLGRALVGLQITTIMFFGLWSNPKPPPEEPIPEEVPLPLQALDRCSVCESERKVRLCANCGEVRDPDIVSGDGTCLSRCSLATLLLKPMPESRLADSQECLR